MPAHSVEDQAAEVDQLHQLAARGVAAAERIAAAFESIAADLAAVRAAVEPQVAAYQSGGWLAVRTARRATAKAAQNGGSQT